MPTHVIIHLFTDEVLLRSVEFSITVDGVTQINITVVIADGNDAAAVISFFFIL
jgi:hypothetical protein